MRTCVMLLAAALLGMMGGRAIAASPAVGTPTVDKKVLADYVRYAEGFTDEVSFSIDDPTPSPFHDFYRVVVHLQAGNAKIGDKIYYVSPDGQHFVNGTVWKVGKSPFEGNLMLLPKNLPFKGAADAKVSIVVFSDFECPYCRTLAQELQQNFPKLTPGSVRVEFADFPLESKHLWAKAAAEAAHCMGDGHNDVFWQYHDWIFGHQDDIKTDGSNLREKVLEFAKEHGVDTAALTTCLDTHTTAAEVTKSEAAAALLGVEQTPTLFVDGRKVEGALPWANLNRLIEYEMKRPQEFLTASP